MGGPPWWECCRLPVGHLAVASGITKVMPLMVIISFAFCSLDASKKRPTGVVCRQSYQEATHDIVLAAVTSPVHEGPGDMALSHGCLRANAENGRRDHGLAAVN